MYTLIFQIIAESTLKQKNDKFLSWLFDHTAWLYVRLVLEIFNNIIIYYYIHFNTRIAQYLKKWRHLDNEIWSVNRI